MKKLLIVLAFFWIQSAHAQTVIPVTTTVYNFSSLANGAYRIITATDTLDLTKDTALKIIKVSTIYDTVTISKICPICPAPIVCPVCPLVPKQRTVIDVSWDIITNKKVFYYDDGSNSTL